MTTFDEGRLKANMYVMNKLRAVGIEIKNSDYQEVGKEIEALKARLKKTPIDALQFYSSRTWLEDKYRNHQYKNDGVWDLVRSFSEWCMNYTNL